MNAKQEPPVIEVQLFKDEPGRTVPLGNVTKKWVSVQLGRKWVSEIGVSSVKKVGKGTDMLCRKPSFSAIPDPEKHGNF
jgi:hypothetical protein